VALAVTIGIGLALFCLWIELLRTSVSGNSRRWEPVAVLGLSVAALSARLFWIGQSSLEHLEVTYLFEAVKPDSLLGVITSRQAAEQMHQPLYTLFLRGWAQIRLDEVWLRLPSAFFATACIPLAYSLVRRDMCAARALLLATITACSPLLVWYGRDASPYALLAFVSLAGVTSAKRMIEESSSWWSVIRTSIWLALAFYTHFLGAWVAITVGVWLLMVRRGFSRDILRLTGVTAVLCLPWLPPMLMKLDKSVKGLAEDKPIMSYSHELSEAVSEAFRMLLGGPFPVWCGLLVLILCGIAVLRKQGSTLAWLAVAAGIIGIASEAHITWQIQQSKGILYVDIRHYIYLVPLLFVPIVALPMRIFALPVVAVQIWSSVPIVTESLEKPDVRGAVAYIEKYAAQREDSDRHAVAYLPAPWYEPLLEYYLFGVCDDLGHARRHEGWWDTATCEFNEGPQPGTIYGFSPNPERAWAARRRLQLSYLWVIDIRDHRFGLPVPPTDPQERYLCWKSKDNALVQRRMFGSWVTLSLYDMQMLRELETGPIPPSELIRSKEVRAADAWPPSCGE